MKDNRSEKNVKKEPANHQSCKHLQLVIQPASQSASYPVIRPVCQPFSHPDSNSVSQSVSHPASQLALVQWLKLPAWKLGDRGFKPHSCIQVIKKQIVSSPLTRKDSILWGTSVTER